MYLWHTENNETREGTDTSPLHVFKAPKNQMFTNGSLLQGMIFVLKLILNLGILPLNQHTSFIKFLWR